ncbi:MAG: WYL domain-containing protein [Lachnospiraceae bacterium]|nr:WYL domain-containing protein [Lachnospiraceae bacterium]
MAKGIHQKQKALYLAKIFSERTDEEHGLTLKEIMALLDDYGVSADRKTLYDDFEQLRDFGLDITAEQVGRETFYKLTSRDFELPELKLLVDSVQSAKFITERKSRALIKKLESLVSTHEAQHLQRQVLISGRVKTMNESVYYSVDKIHTAISSNAQIRFHYFQWNVKKEMELRKDGDWYIISPWALIWDDEYYYLLGYDAAGEKMKHYRVDKMLDMTILSTKREGLEVYKTMDIPRYAKGLFGMFGGEVMTVSLECENRMASVVIDRFGKDIPMIVTDENHFKTRVEISSSENFLGWVAGLGGRIRITAPESLVNEMKALAEKLVAQYS